MELSHQILVGINDEVRKTSTTLLQYFVNIEKELVGNTLDGCEIDSLKMYKGSMGYCRTTHSAPIGQKHSGWSNTKHIGEIGWNGRVQIVYKGNNSPNFHCPDILEIISIHGGSGGFNGDHKGNLYKLNYDSEMFIKDLPLIYNQYLDFISHVEELGIKAMLNSQDPKDRKLAEGIIEAVLYDEIIEIKNVLIGWNNNSIHTSIYSLFESIIRPYYNVQKQREVWSENKNLGWILKDPYYAYGSNDLTHL